MHFQMRYLLGLTMSFKAYWDVIGPNITALIQYYYEGKIPMESINSSFYSQSI